MSSRLRPIASSATPTAAGAAGPKRGLITKMLIKQYIKFLVIYLHVIDEK